nr:integrase family protein [uncultured Roseococcus sp.]
MRISKQALNLLQRTPPAVRTVYDDDELKGFGVRQSPAGAISYFLRYRVKGDPKLRFVTLGDYPTVVPDKAREEARSIKAAAQLGEDLMAKRAGEKADAEAMVIAARRQAQDAQKRALPVSVLLDEWRIATEASIAADQAAGRSTRHEKEMLRYEANHLRPAVGADAVGDFDPAKLQALLFRQPSVYLANNLRKTIARFTKFANAELALRGLPIRWPTKFEVEGRATTREDYYTLEQAARIWIACGDLGRRGAMVRLMLLTGARLTEARRMTYSDLHLDDSRLGPHWAQPQAHTKNKKTHLVPLVPPIVAMLRWLPPRKILRGQTSPLVFSGRGGVPLSGITPIREAMRAGAGLKSGTLHDLRRTIVTVLGDHGFDPHVADKLLNHVAAATLPGVMAVYQRSEFWLKKREAVDLFSGLLMSEVERIQGSAIDRETWGFDQPFDDAVIRTTKVPELPKRPSPARTRRAPSSRI